MEKKLTWDILENEVPTCVLPTTLRIYSKVFITMQIYKTFVHSSEKNGRRVKSEKIIQFFEYKVIIHYTANPQQCWPNAKPARFSSP